MDSKILLRTVGYISIAIGLYLLYKGGDSDLDTQPIDLDNIIDAEFTIIDD